LRDLGYVEGKNLVVEYRWTERKVERIEPFIDELIRLTVAVIVGAGQPVLFALHRKTEAVPVVMTNSEDPVRAGFAVSLARPGGNITGLTGISPELAGKRVDLLRDTLPGLQRIALLWHRTSGVEQLKSAQSAAKVRTTRVIQ